MIEVMGLLDMLSMLMAGGAALECAVGRVGAMDRRHHKPGVMAAYFLAALLCGAAALAPLEGVRAPLLQLAATVVAVHLLITLADWRHGPPASVLRDDARQLVPVAVDSKHEADR